MGISSSSVERAAETYSSSQIPSNSFAEPVPVALIGVGGFGRSHLRCLEVLQRQGRARLVAVADNSDRLVAEKQSLISAGVRWYCDYREMLVEEKELRAVQIASPVPFHYEMTAACLERGLFVRVEKPPVVLIQQLEDLIAHDSDERVSVAFQHIDSIQIQTLKRWIVEGKLGHVRDIRVSACWPRLASYYNRPWVGRMSYQKRPVFDGPATNALSHLVHNIMFLQGAGQGDFAIPDWVEGEFYRVRPIEGYDLAILRGEFGGGTAFTISVTHATEQEQPYQIEVRGDRDWAHLSEDGLRLETSAGVHLFSGKEMEDDAHVRAQRNFLDFVAGGSPRPSTRLRDTRGFVLTINAGLLSSGGIHSVPSSLVRSYCREGDSGVNLAGLGSLIGRSRQEGALLHELGVPWAHIPHKMFLKDLRHLSLDAYLPREATPANTSVL